MHVDLTADEPPSLVTAVPLPFSQGPAASRRPTRFAIAAPCQMETAQFVEGATILIPSEADGYSASKPARPARASARSRRASHPPRSPLFPRSSRSVVITESKGFGANASVRAAALGAPKGSARPLAPEELAGLAETDPLSLEGCPDVVKVKSHTLLSSSPRPSHAPPLSSREASLPLSPPRCPRAPSKTPRTGRQAL